MPELRAPEVTPRVALAAAAAAGAASCAAVVGLDAGPDDRWATGDVHGVVALADGPDGRYAVTVHVRVLLVDDLRALGGDIARSVRDGVRRAGLAEQLGPVHVAITDVELAP